MANRSAGGSHSREPLSHLRASQREPAPLRGTCPVGSGRYHRAMLRAALPVFGLLLLLAGGPASGVPPAASRTEPTGSLATEVGVWSTRSLETITVSNTSPRPVFSTTVLQADHRYRLVAGGTVSDWCNGTSFPCNPPLALADGVDALYCYAKWRCSTPTLWRQLQVNGKGLDEIAGQAGKIPYSASHKYTVEITGITGKLKLVALDALNGSAGDNGGQFTVDITDLGSVAAKVTFSVVQNGLPEEPRAGDLVRSQTTGRGSVIFRLSSGCCQGVAVPELGGGLVNPGRAEGSIVHVDSRIVAGRRLTQRFVIRVIGAKYRWAPAVGSRPATRVLQLGGTVTSSTDRECPAGRAALIVLRDAGGEDGLNILLQLCQRTHRTEQFEVTRDNRLAVRVRQPIEVGGS